jgi:FkbM family methyltransferase
MTLSEKITQLNEYNYLVRGRHGLFLANRYDYYLGYALIRYGEFSELEGQFLCSLVQPGDVVVEVGSNIGALTIPLAQRVGLHGKVIAIEAQPAIFQYLCANIALNGLFNVATHQCGCGADYESMYIPKMNYAATGKQNFGGVSLSKQDTYGVAVKVVPLDDLIEDLPNVKLLKLDVEGMEGDVLTGATKTILRHRPGMYIENDRPEKSQALIEQIMGLDYRLWWHFPQLFNPNNYFGVNENDYGNIVSLNMLCLPREESIHVNGLLEITNSTRHPLRE